MVLVGWGNYGRVLGMKGTAKGCGCGGDGVIG